MDKKISNMKKGFIAQTAQDYDMSFDEVERIYNLYPKSNEFYEKLEEHIKQRSKLNELPIKTII